VHCRLAQNYSRYRETLQFHQKWNGWDIPPGLPCTSKHRKHVALLSWASWGVLMAQVNTHAAPHGGSSLMIKQPCHSHPRA